MDFSQEFLMDMAINGAGFLTAGLIGMVFYALFFNKGSSTEKEVVQETNTKLPKPTQPAPSLQKHHADDVKFIQLGSNATNAVSPVEKKENKQSARVSRKEVISLARKMLEAGSTTENIKRILPVSDAELALLRLNNK